MLKPSPKIFRTQKSLLEDLHEKGYFPIYPFIPLVIAVISFGLLLLYFITCEGYERDAEFLRSYFRSEYNKLHITIALNLVIFFSSILIVFHGFAFWQSFRRLFAKKSYVDNTALVLWASFYILLFVLPFRYMDIHELHFISRSSIMVLQVHNFGKAHSYIRENIPKVLSYDKKHEDEEEPKRWQPNFKRYIYFISAPTYIYRDSYPRTKNVDWRKCFQYFVGTFCSIVLPIIPMAFCFAAESYKCQSRHSPMEYVWHTIPLFIYSSIALFVMTEYGILHYAFNLWAEMRQFGDRMFYADWWNARSYFDLAQKWSFFVHEWLYTYIYLDCRNVLQLNKKTAAIMAFLVSAILHDYAAAVAFGFTLPLLCFSVLLYIILLPRTFVRKITTPHKENKSSKLRLWTGFLFFYFIITISYYWVLCDSVKCSSSHEFHIQASWISIIYPRAFRC